MKLKFLIFILFLNCIQPPPNPNTEFTISKKDTEKLIAQYTFLKTLSCNFEIGQVAFFSELGNDQDPKPNAKNHSILYEKKAVKHCLSSILVIPCPILPTNTSQAIENMVFNITSNRRINCTFATIEFFTFEKPLSGSFWQP